MKKTAFFLMFTVLFLTGCQQVTEQVDKTKASAEKVYEETTNKIESTKKQIIETKEKVDEKVNDVNNAMESVSKVVQ